MNNQPLPKNFRRNFTCLALDFCFFGLAMSFFGPSTVVPSLLTRLGASSLVIGAVSTLQRAGWLLPQLFAARALADKPLKKRYILIPGLLSRPMLLVTGLVLWLTGARPASAMIGMIIAVMGLFWIGDGFASLAWFDVLSKAVPPHRRGRLTGTGQVLSSILGFFAGIIVEWMLSAQGPTYPRNYSILFFIGFGFMSLSTIALASIKEAPGIAEANAPSWKDYLPQLRDIIKNDHTFRRFLIARQLFNFAMLASPFYMVYALEKLCLPDYVAGRYTSIGVVGGMLAAVAFGWINERKGTKRATQGGMIATALMPISALVIPLVVKDRTWLAWAYGLVFFFNSVSMSSYLPGWTAYVLELAPEAKRPSYVGLTNTLNGITSLASLVGGAILQWTDSNYVLLFLISLVGMASAWPLLAAIPDPRQNKPLDA